MLLRRSRNLRKMGLTYVTSLGMMLGAVLSIVLAEGCQKGFTLPAEQAENAKSEIKPAQDAVPADAVTGTVQGQLMLLPAIAGEVKAGDTVYVMARWVDNGKIVGVERLIAVGPEQWPMPFTISDERMHPGMQLQITARVDKDGDATTKLPGDVISEESVTVSVPAKGIRIMMQHML